MIRRPRNEKYQQKAIYINPSGKELVFYCREKKMNNVTNELGQSMPMANGYKMLETDAPIDFKQEHPVILNGEKLTITQADSIVDETNKNLMRGAPTFITTLLIN